MAPAAALQHGVGSDEPAILQDVHLGGGDLDFDGTAAGALPGTRAIVDASFTAWNNLIAENGLIRSLADFEWARQVNL